MLVSHRLGLRDFAVHSFKLLTNRKYNFYEDNFPFWQSSEQNTCQDLGEVSYCCTTILNYCMFEELLPQTLTL